MRLSKRIGAAILLSTCLARLLVAQKPISIGSTPTAILDWLMSTPSGCNPSSPLGYGTTPGFCVGSTSIVQGDTMYTTAWAADAVGMPLPSGLPLIFSLNDFSLPPSCGGNTGVAQLSVFDWATPNASRMDAVNCFTSMNGADSPSGWHGKFTSSDTGGGGAVWHSKAPFFRGGKLYLPIYRNPSSGVPTAHDTTILRSDDKGVTWRNPYTVSIAGTPHANGDAPLCGAASGASACADAHYSTSIMWQNLPGGVAAFQAVEYMQDGATPPAGINDGCDPAIWTCFMADPNEGTIARVLNTDLPSLDVTKYQYYTCPTITDKFRCDGLLPGSWSSNLADRTPAGRPRGMAQWMSVTYHPEFGGYLGVGEEQGTVFAWASNIYGPWTIINNTGRINGVLPEFQSVPLALKQVISTNPPHSRITVASNTKAYTISGTPFFSQWDMVLGRTPDGTGEVPVFTPMGQPPGSVLGPVHSGVIFSDGHAPGTIPRNGLQWLFDFYDLGVLAVRAPDQTGFWQPAYHDIANGSAVLMPCSTSGALSDWLPSQGLTATAGIATVNQQGYSTDFRSMRHETPDTIGTAGIPNFNLSATNAPQAMQGNGTYTVAGVFRYDSGSNGALWSTGGASLQYGTSGAGLTFAWGGNSLTSSFNLAAGNWYFIALTVVTNGANPIVKAWVGNAGKVQDKMVGATRTGSTAPSISAAPMILGSRANASFAWFSVHSRALGQSEVDLMYRTAKAKMAARGVTLQ